MKKVSKFAEMLLQSNQTDPFLARSDINKSFSVNKSRYITNACCGAH